MAVINSMALQFSKDGKYCAQISIDGKLKVWNTITNTFEQEFTPDFHLTSPCTCLQFIDEGPPIPKVGPPKKKKRRDSQGIANPIILLGTTNGHLLSYSIAKGKIVYNVDTTTNLHINCLSSDQNDRIYLGAESNILVWSLKKRKLLAKWSAVNEKISAILAIPDSQKVLTASKQIILWNAESKEKLGTYTGHSTAVCLLYYVSPRENSADSYFISGSTGDRLLSCWNLNENSNTMSAVAKFSMDDIIVNLSVLSGNDGSTLMAACVRNGVVHVYQNTLNGKTNKKPLKPKTTVQVVCENKTKNITPIHINGSVFRDEQTLCIGYGNAMVKTFENISLADYKKVHCIVRKDPQTIALSKDQQKTKLLKPIVDNDVHYLTPFSKNASTSSVKRKNDGQLEVPMERRLENLSLNKLDINSKTPKSDNVAQLLLQGLHSKDKTILKTALCKRDEQIIKNTIKRLPVAVIIPLIQELTQLIQGKTLSSQIGAMWLKQLISVNAAVLLSNPELPELFSTVLGNIESRLLLQTPLTRLKGRLDLLVEQVKVVAPSQEVNAEEDEAMLVFNENSESENESEIDENEIVNNENGSSDSENEWMDQDGL